MTTRAPRTKPTPEHRYYAICDLLREGTTAYLQLFIERAVKISLDRLDYVHDQLKAVDMDAEKYAPYPYGGSRKSYRMGEALYHYVRRYFSLDHTRHPVTPGRRGPHYLLLNSTARADVTRTATEEAKVLFEAFIQKMAAKVVATLAHDDVVLGATLTGELWLRCTLTISLRTEQKHWEQVWTTKCILNRSVYNKLFNQWPTRRKL